MREVLTAIGIFLCLALTALMAGPHFVDWSAYRPELERKIGALAGAPVVIEGPVHVTLLPIPFIAIDQIRIGAADSRNLKPFSAERVTIALAATALLRGDIQITEASVEGLILRLGAATVPGSSAATGGAIGPAQISLDKLTINDGLVVVERPGQADLTIANLGAEIEATSLLGPAKGSGSFAVGDATRSFRFALGRLEGEKMRIKALVEDLQLALRLDIDGAAGRDGTGAPNFEGTIGVSGNPILGDKAKGLPLPLRATAKAKYAGDLLSLDDLAVILGSDPQPMSMAGEATLRLGARPRIEATLSARSFDFDRIGQDGKPQLAVPAELIRRAAALIPDGPGGNLPDGSLDLTVGGVIIGGQTIIGARLVSRQEQDGLSIASFEGELPGQTRVKFARSASAQPGLLGGRVEIEARDPERLLNWYAGTTGALTGGVALKASALLSSVADGVRLEEIRIERGETVLSGEGRYLLAAAGQRPAAQLALKLTSPRLNIADIPSVDAGAEKADDRKEFDFDLDISAAKLVFEGNETGKLVARVRRDGPIVSIERIAVTEFGGANLIASGTLGGGARRLTVKVEADKVDALTALGEKLLPGALTEGLRKRAGQIAPALVVASFTNEDADDSYLIRADGRLAGTKIEAGGKLAGRHDLKLDLDLSLDNPEGALLAAQIGGRPPTSRAGGAGTVSLSMRGNPRGALSTLLTGAMPGIDARVTGTIKIFQPFAPFEGDITIKAVDLGPVGEALGIVNPALPKGATGTLNGRVVSNLERITIEKLNAVIGGQPFAGEIAFSLTENGKVSGQIKTPSVDFRPVIAMAFGTTSLRSGTWSTTAFGKPLAPPLAGDLWIEASKARLSDDLAFDDAKFVLRFAEGAASIEYAHLQRDQMRIEGDVLLRRTGASAFLSSKLKVAGLRLDRFGEGAARGEIDGEAHVSGSGDTPSKLVAALSGGGDLTLRGKTTPRFDPAALSRLLAVPLEQIGPLDAANLGHRLESELDKASWTLPEARTSMVVFNGVVRSGIAGFDAVQSRHEASASLDLSSMALDYKISTTAAQPPRDWRGAAPQFTTTWRGPISAPKREVAVDALVNGYLALALVRDLDKAEQLDQDIRERSMQLRRSKAEEARRKADEAMLKAEEAARLQEDERVKREQAEAEARLRQEKAAEEERQRLARLQEDDRQRALKAAEDEAALRQRIQRVIQQEEMTATPQPRRNVVPPAAVAVPQTVQPAAVLPPPLNLNPPLAGRPRVAAPVEVRPLPAPGEVR